MNTEHHPTAAYNTLSVVIATYNAAGTLQRCLQSILRQEHPGIKIIVIDGESTDDTINILKLYHESVFWISEPDSGIYDALNKALPYIKTDWVYFMGADDELLPDFSGFLSVLIDPQTIYYANVIHNDKKMAGKLSPYYMAKVGIYHQAIVYPKAVFKHLNYNICYPIFADYALNMQCYGNQEFQFEYRDHTIAKYNHTGISSYAIDDKFEQDKAGLILKNFGPAIWLRYRFRLFKEKLRSRH